MNVDLDPELVARAINFHGQPLQKIWESERGESDIQKLNVDLDLDVYTQRQKHLGFQDRGKRLKLHQFIAKKANVLFNPDINEREERPPTRGNEPGLYAVLPPYDSFLNIDKSSRVKNFFQCVKVGDIVYASIVSKMSSGLMLKILCVDGETARVVSDLNIKAHCHTVNLIPAVDKKNISRPFLINDLVCCEVLEVVADSEKMSCGMKGVHTSEHRARLGLIHSDDFPDIYKQAQEYTKGDLYNDLLENNVGFNNPSNINCLSNTLGLGINNFTYMNGMRDRFPEGEYASELRQVQASKWAFRSVAEGIEHFKAGRHTEAFQCLNKALTIDTRNIDGLVARGALYANSGNYKKAIEDFESALKLNQNHQNARRYLGETLVAYGRSFEDQNKMEEALKAYERCLTIVPYHEEAQNSIEYIKSKQANGGPTSASATKITEPELTIPGLTPSKAQGVKDTLKQLIGDSASKEDSKKKKKEKKRRRHHRSSSTSSSSSSASSSSSSSSSSSDSSSGSSQDSHHKKKHKHSRKGDHKDRSLSPLSKRMAMMEDSTAENEGLPGSGSQRGGSHYNPPSMPFSFTGEPQASAVLDSYAQEIAGKQEKESEYEQRVRKFLEQTKGDLDYEEKVRKFLDETAKWKNERKALEAKAKKKKKKEKKARSKNKKKKREEKRKKKELKEIQEKKIREVLRREKQRRRSTSQMEGEDEDYLFADKSDLRILGMGSLNELEDLQSKLSAYYAKVEKGTPLSKKKENSSEKSLGSISGIGKGKLSPKSMYDDQDDLKHDDDSPPPSRSTWDSVAEKKRLDMFADSPNRHANTKIIIPQSSDAQNNMPSKFKMQIGNVGNRLKKKDKSEETKEPWDEVEDTRIIYVKEDGESNDDILPKKIPDMKKKELDTDSLAKRPALLDKLGGFRINPLNSEKKKDLSPDIKPQKRKIRTRTSDTETSDSDHEPPRRNLKKDQDRSPDSSRSRSRSRSRKKYSSESPKKYSSESRSSSYRKERSRSKSGSYRSRSRRYGSSESGSYRSRSYSRSRSRSRSGDYYRRSRSRSDDRHHYRNKYQGRYPRNRGTYYRPRFQNYKSPRGGGNYVNRGYRSRGYNNRGGNRGYIPRMRGRGRRPYYHHKPQDRRDYRRYDRGISRSDDDDMSPMRKVDAAKERIDKLIAEEKRHTGPLSEGEEREDDEYIDRKEYDGKWASKDSEGQRLSSPTNDDDMDKFLKGKSQKSAAK